MGFHTEVRPRLHPRSLSVSPVGSHKPYLSPCLGRCWCNGRMPPKSHYPQSDEGNAVSPRALEVNSSQLPGSSHPRAPALAALIEAGKSQPWWTNTCRKRQDRNNRILVKMVGLTFHLFWL